MKWHAGAPKLLSQNQAAQLGGDALRRRTQLSDSMLSCVYCVYSSISQEVILLIRILQLPPLSHLFFLPLKESFRNDDPSVRMETSYWLDYTTITTTTTTTTTTNITVTTTITGTTPVQRTLCRSKTNQVIGRICGRRLHIVDRRSETSYWPNMWPENQYFGEIYN